MEVTIKLTVEQIQRALTVLGQAPYMQIADVIDAVKAQVNKQLAEQQRNNKSD